MREAQRHTYEASQKSDCNSSLNNAILRSAVKSCLAVVFISRVYQDDTLCLGTRRCLCVESTEVAVSGKVDAQND
jgi:hypothetical protein